MNPFRSSEIISSTLGIVMGGGSGRGLFPLTKDRAKPAVPLGGKFRLVDIPISNCINSGIRQIFVLTQYNSAPLNRHITNSYRFDAYSGYFVNILAAQQTAHDPQWYQGNADAVRQNLGYFKNGQHQYFLIISGDHLYRMDFRSLLEHHVTQNAEITIATTMMGPSRVHSLGVVQTDSTGAIQRFVEKPTDPEILASLMAPAEIHDQPHFGDSEPRYQANMGIYVFNRDVLISAMENQCDDFGRHIIPAAVEKHRVHSYLFNGYWENIGTIGAFFQANLDLCATIPKYNFFDSLAPIFTRSRFLPATKINGGLINHSLLSDGCIISQASIERCVLGLRTVVEVGSRLRDCVIMGSNYYNDAVSVASGPAQPGIGKNCNIERAIIDKNVSVGDNVVIASKLGQPNFDHPEGLYYVRDGIVVIPRNTVIPPGMKI